MASALNDGAPGTVQIPDDGVALHSSAHPRPPWHKRLWFWAQQLFGYPRLGKASIEKVSIEILDP